jgi:hypothetical protein
MDPHSFSKLDPDPHKVNADPQHWAILLVSDKSEADIYVGLGFFYRFGIMIQKNPRTSSLKKYRVLVPQHYY